MSPGHAAECNLLKPCSWHDPARSLFFKFVESWRWGRRRGRAYHAIAVSTPLSRSVPVWSGSHLRGENGTHKGAASLLLLLLQAELAWPTPLFHQPSERVLAGWEDSERVSREPLRPRPPSFFPPEKAESIKSTRKLCSLSLFLFPLFLTELPVHARRHLRLLWNARRATHCSNTARPPAPRLPPFLGTVSLLAHQHGVHQTPAKQCSFPLTRSAFLAVAARADETAERGCKWRAGWITFSPKYLD